MKLGLLAAAWLAGTFVALRLDPALLPLALLLLAALSGGVLARFYHWPLWPVVLAAVALVAVIRAEASDGPAPPLATSDGQTVTVRGRVVNDPEATAQFFRLVIEAEAIDRGGGDQPFPLKELVKVLVYAEPPASMVSSREPPYFRYGDNLVIKGQVQLLSAIADFDYPAYLANQGISGVIYSRSALLVEPVAGNGGGWRGRVFDLRGRLADNLEDALPERHSAIGQALLLGKRGRLPEDMVENFRSTGTSHILAISGLHVGSMMIMALALAAAILGKRWSAYLLFPLALIWFYVLISGAPPSAIRAAIMGTVYLAALGLGRPRSLLPALALSAAAMAAHNPQVLQQTSFQLSFGAMAGIALALPLQERVDAAIASRTAAIQFRGGLWLSFMLRWVAASLIVSLGATLATWPLVGFNFDRIPLLGILATALALPALPLILLGTLATSLGGLFHPAIGQMLGWLTWAPISYLMELVSRFPTLTVSGGWIGSWLVWTWFVLLGSVLLLAKGTSHLLPRESLAGRLLRQPAVRGAAPAGVSASGQRKYLLAISLIVASILVWTHVFAGPDGKLHVYFFDVGQGDSVLIVTPSGRQILVDGGPGNQSATAALSGRLPAGDRSLDMVVLTHLDSDHSRGLLEVLDRYRVASVLFGLENPQSAMYPQWRSMLDRENAIEILAQAGQVVVLEPGVSLQVLNPPERTAGVPAKDQNNNGVVLRLVYGEVSFLLTADIESPAENRLVRSGPTMGSAVLKVAHHGSRTSTTPAFLAGVGPSVAVISVGAANRFGHPRPEILERLGDAIGEDGIFRTDRDGTVEFISDGQALWVKTDR